MSMHDLLWTSAAEIVRVVAAREISATEVATAALETISRLNPTVNAFTTVTADRALARAKAIDAISLAARQKLPLAGAPFAVKNLFDIEGITTRAGSKINRDNAPALRDSPLIERLEAAGAILVGALNMGEYAYDFTGENPHDGPSRNPHDPSRMTGGSSSGSAAAVAGGLVPISLGTDTNGSVRVPASLCGIFGLKPTYGRLPRNRSFPFVSSFDHAGVFARSVTDLALSYDAMQGYDPGDPVCVNRPVEPVGPISASVGKLRIATAGGYFRDGATPESLRALVRVGEALSVSTTVELPEVQRARSAAFVISAAEGAALHRQRLRERPNDFEPAVRDRFIGGSILPASYVVAAQKFRRWFQGEMLKLFEKVDVILAPAAPCTAPLIGQQTFSLAGRELPVKANLGIHTQPISFIGLPVVAVPVDVALMPIGVQIIAAPWREDIALNVAAALERTGAAVVRRPALAKA